jgi:hypothetical protein
MDIRLERRVEMENSLITLYCCIIKTPIWVYVLLAYLLWIGYQSSKKRVISLKKLFIMPVVFAFMSIHSMLGELKGADWMVIIWFFGLSMGALGGWFLVHRLKPQIDKKTWFSARKRHLAYHVFNCFDFCV